MTLLTKMTTDKENTETLNVEIEREVKKSRNGTSTRQLYVQVKRRRVKRQYRRNQDAINFLRRFTLIVVLIDVILSISESSLVSTFFLFMTLSTTFEVKPENVIDTYCYYYQGGGNSMCEQYMERVTGYTPSSQSTNHHRHSQASTPPENHFPTVPSRPPLTPLETRKLFLAYNQSLYDFPIQFNMVQKIDKDSKLSKLYARLVYLLFDNNPGILNATTSLSEFLTNENGFDDAFVSAFANNLTDSSLKSKKTFIETLITKQLKQSIKIISSHAPFLLDPMENSNYLLFRLCSKMLIRLKAEARKIKQKRIRDDNNNNNKQSYSIKPNEHSLINPYRKNLIQATEFVRHRWKRDAFIPLSTATSVNTNTEEIKEALTGNFENGRAQQNVEKEGEGMPAATGSSVSSMEEERGTAAVIAVAVEDDESVREKENEESSLFVSAPSSTIKHSPGSGYRLIKGNSGSNKKQLARDLEGQTGQIVDDNFYDAVPKSIISRREASYSGSHDAISPITNQSREYCRRDVQMIFTMAAGNLNDLMLNKSSRGKTNKTEQGREQTNRKFQNEDGKYLEELSLGLDKNPRHVLSLIEVALFNNWQNFVKISKRLPVYYRVDENDTPRQGDKEDSLAWLTVRQKIMENLMLNMETNAFSQENLKKAERRKRAIEQIYHDYSFTILGELKNVKEMPVSRTFHGIYWVIKIYVIVWQITVCMVLFFGSVFEDKTALNIWGIFNILTSLLHFMVDDWINTSFQPEKTSASIWFGVIYGVYKPITILLVATLSSEIYKQDGGKKKGVVARVCEIIRGRKRPPLIADKCLKKLKGLFITAETVAENECGNGGDGKKNKNNGETTIITTPGENNNGNIVYKGIKAVKIRAKIKRMEMDNGSLIVFTQTQTPAPIATGVKNESTTCLICGTSAGPTMACSDERGNGNLDEEKVHEGRLFYPCVQLDNEAGMTAEDLYPEETDDEEDEDELEEVVDEDEDELEEVVDEDDESDEEDDGDNEICSQQPDHDRNIRDRSSCSASVAAKDDNDAGMPREKIHAEMVMLSEAKKTAGGSKNPHSGLSLIAYARSGIQGNLKNDSNARAPGQSQGEELLRGPIVDGGNLYI